MTATDPGSTGPDEHEPNPWESEDRGTGSAANGLPVEDKPVRGNLATTLGNIKELLTNVVGIVTVVTSALATFGVGAVVGHNADPQDPAPAHTIYVTVTPTATPTPSTDPTSPGTPSPSLATTPPSANGTLLGSYSIDLGFGHSVPLGPTKPTQAEFSTSGLGDLGTASPADHLVFVPINGDKMVALTGGTTPTYDACSTDTVFAGQADSAPGTSFCLLETGRIAGVVVTSVQPSYAVLKVGVWQNIS